MNKPTAKISWRAAALASVALAFSAAGACGDDGGDEASGTRSVALTFDARFGDEAFGCDKTYDGIGAGAVSVAPRDMRFYVHDIRLVDVQGREHPIALDQDGLWQTEDLALLDFEDNTGTCINGTAETNRVVRGSYDSADPIDVTAVRFRLGVPFALNHGDVAAAASPLNLSGLFWNWQGGYKFLRADVGIVGTDAGFNVHIGSTGCSLDASTQRVSTCTAPNRAEIELDDFDPAEDTIVFDYAEVVAEVDIATDQGGAVGCQSKKDDPECPLVFSHLGLDLTSGQSQPGQTAFRLD